MNNTQEKMATLAAKLTLLAVNPEHSNEEIFSISKELAELGGLDLRESPSPATQIKLIRGYVKFTQKEISLMPTRFRKIIRLEGCTIQAYKRISGTKHKKINYELRYRRNGYNIYVSSNNIDTAKKKFIEKLHRFENGDGQNDTTKVPVLFDDFTRYYFENFRKRKVKPQTYTKDGYRYKNHIFPYFGNQDLRKITPLACQTLLDNLTERKLFKTRDEVHSLLNIIFKSAIVHNIITQNPMSLVVNSQHERKHGKALTKAEEKLLLSSYKGTPFETMFAVILYTGLRPNEYITARIDGEFIVAVASKKKDGLIEYKKIPITPMLRPYLKQSDDELIFKSPRVLRDKLQIILPKHKLYDLRTTFYTRCQEKGVAPIALKEFMGHAMGALERAYTDLSDEFLIQEGAKLNY